MSLALFLLDNAVTFMKKVTVTTEEERQKIESAVQSFADLMIKLLGEKESSKEDTDS